MDKVKSSYLKDLLINEYKETIGFKERSVVNKSEWVYDVGGGGNYIEAAISSLGISDEQLIQNLAPRLSKKIKDSPTIPWPPHLDHLEEGNRGAAGCGIAVHQVDHDAGSRRAVVDRHRIRRGAAGLL